MLGIHDADWTDSLQNTPCSSVEFRLILVGMKRTLLALVCFALACGEKKPAKDPNAEGVEESTSPSGSEPSGSTETPKPSEASPSKPIVNEQGERSKNSYDKENTEVVLSRAARQVKANCGATKDEDGKMIGPWGKVTIKVMLGRNGHTKAVTVPAPYDAKPVGKCISNAFSILAFPPWAGADTEVDWEVELVEPPKASKK